MIRNYKQEEKLKEMGVKDPQKFIRYRYSDIRSSKADPRVKTKLNRYGKLK